jgi:hypothetical protein
MLAVHLKIVLLAAALIAPGQEPAQPSAEPLTAAEIMARAAVNQDHSETIRKQYVYR